MEEGIEGIIGVILGIFLVIVLFFMVLPEIATITGTLNLTYVYLLGVLLIIALILSLLKE